MVVLLCCLDADAAAIHRHPADPSVLPLAGMPAAELSVFREWSRYLVAGPSVWSRVEHPPWTEAVRTAAWESVKTDPGGTESMVKFLLWKQAIDPPRFAHYHPRLAPALHRIRMERSSALASHFGTTTAGSGGGTSSTPSTSTTSPVTSAQNLAPPAVPEPGMLLVAAGMTGWFVRRRYRARGA
jgi:hypothetical protein